MGGRNEIQREILPIPDRRYAGEILRKALQSSVESRTSSRTSPLNGLGTLSLP